MRNLNFPKALTLLDKKRHQSGGAGGQADTPQAAANRRAIAATRGRYMNVR